MPTSSTDCLRRRRWRRSWTRTTLWTHPSGTALRRSLGAVRVDGRAAAKSALAKAAAAAPGKAGFLPDENLVMGLLTDEAQTRLKTAAALSDQQCVAQLASQTVAEEVLDLIRHENSWTDHFILRINVAGQSLNLAQPIRLCAEKVRRFWPPAVQELVEDAIKGGNKPFFPELRRLYADGAFDQTLKQMCAFQAPSAWMDVVLNPKCSLRPHPDDIGRKFGTELAGLDYLCFSGEASGVLGLLLTAVTAALYYKEEKVVGLLDYLQVAVETMGSNRACTHSVLAIQDAHQVASATTSAYKSGERAATKRSWSLCLGGSEITAAFSLLEKIEVTVGGIDALNVAPAESNYALVGTEGCRQLCLAAVKNKQTLELLDQGLDDDVKILDLQKACTPTGAATRLGLYCFGEPPPAVLNGPPAQLAKVLPALIGVSPLTAVPKPGGPLFVTPEQALLNVHALARGADPQTPGGGTGMVLDTATAKAAAKAARKVRKADAAWEASGRSKSLKKLGFLATHSGSEQSATSAFSDASQMSEGARRQSRIAGPARDGMKWTQASRMLDVECLKSDRGMW
mmetsp:Transcript_69189/g.193479  ORF Transcript_69189/g.193479 Transcript_69189/m.193479 type:complete len:570 (-) Transcript_69189:811-2520(-)